jgi:hypothetical protein
MVIYFLEAKNMDLERISAGLNRDSAEDLDRRM